MSDEEKWLLIFGRGWIPWYELADGPVGEQDVNPIYERLTAAGKIELDRNRMVVRLKENK